jgi:OOP family OmpA-OmpF porin
MTLQKSRALNVLAAAAALACMAGAHAEETSYNPNDYILLNGSAIQPDSKLVPNKIGAGGGLKLGIPLNPSWDLQIGGNYAESNDNGGKYHQYLAGVDALYLLRPAGFRPFLLGGVGVSRDSSSDPVNGSFRRTSPYVNAGLGFQYKINPQLGVQADIREVASFYRDKVNAPDMSRSANTYVNVGLTWAFGGPPAPPPPIVKRVDTTTTTTVETTPPPPPPPVIAPPPPPPKMQ